MSWQGMDAVDRVPHGEVKELAYRVLLKLANVSAQDGTRAWRNMHEVAAELGVSVRSIRRSLQELERDRIIVRGDQHHVGHIRADRRPIVYDLNMTKLLNWDSYHGLESTPLNGVTDGVTEISTTPHFEAHGVTDGVTTAVPHRELREQPTKSSSTGDSTRACAKSPHGEHDGEPGGWCWWDEHRIPAEVVNA